MRVAPWVVNAVASSSRSTARATGRDQLGHVAVGSRVRHNSEVSRSSSDLKPPPLSTRDKGKRREDIRYDIGGAGHSNDKQAYFAKPISSSTEEGGVGSDWVVDGSDVSGGVESGRVVECRRYVLLHTSSTLELSGLIETTT